MTTLERYHSKMIAMKTLKHIHFWQNAALLTPDGEITRYFRWSERVSKIIATGKLPPFEIFDLEVGQCQRVRNDAIRWHILKSTNVMFCTCALALTILEIVTLEIFYLETLGQGQRIHHSQ